MDLHTKIEIPTTVFAQQVDDEIVLLDTESKNYFGLDAIGAVMWGILEEDNTLEYLYLTMLEKYEVQPDKLHSDIIVFIDNLIKNKLVRLG